VQPVVLALCVLDVTVRPTHVFAHALAVRAHAFAPDLALRRS
jgi:hypothetical protein